MCSRPHTTYLSGDGCLIVLTSVREIKGRATSAGQQLFVSTEVLINCLKPFNLENANELLLPDATAVNMVLNPYKGRVTVTCKEGPFNNNEKIIPKSIQSHKKSISETPHISVTDVSIQGRLFSRELNMLP